MVLRDIAYTHNGKKRRIKAKVCSNVFSKGTGLMFRKNSPPLLFPFKKFRKLGITSIFCRPFTALWLDENMHVIKSLEVKNWKWKIPGHGKYLLEIPITSKK